MAPVSLPAAPYRRPATTEPPASTTPRRRFSTGPGHKAEAQSAFQPAMHSRLPSTVGCSHGRIGPDTVRGIKNSFFDLFNPRNISKIPKFVKTCRNVQKWQTKFCWTPLGHIYAMGLTKFTFVQYSIMHNYKNSNTKINVYKYLYLQIS
jgi:hypothetical protein